MTWSKTQVKASTTYTSFGIALIGMLHRKYTERKMA